MGANFLVEVHTVYRLNKIKELADFCEPLPTCRNEAYYCYQFECSNCGCVVAGGDELGHNSSHGDFNYCPNCGARVINNAN